MIKLTRIRTHPPIHENFFGPKRIEANLKLLKQKRDGELDKKGEKKWNSSFWKESKAQLLIESNNKCAYCETPTRVVAYGDVEHFRPKSIYWWLAYSYENYLPSCGACNQEYKKDLFELEDKKNQLPGIQLNSAMSDVALQSLAPTLTVDPITDTQGKKLIEFIKELRMEKALLVNPYFDDPSIYFAYKPILENKEVVIIPTKPKYGKVIKICEELFGLNRKELLDLRFQRYCLYMTLRYTLTDAAISANTRLMSQNRLNEMVSDKSAYAGMVRYFDKKLLGELPWDFNILSI
jgi:uncharacterized protein (TIGR02646 family)